MLSYSAGIADFNPTAHWTLDETSGTRLDSTTNGWDLTDVNTVGYTTGALNNASDHVGASSEYLRTGSDFTGFGTQAITLNFWLKTTTDMEDSFLIANNDGGATTFEMGTVYNSNQYQCHVRTTTNTHSSPTISETTIEDGNWSMLTCTYDGSKVRVYENCVEVGSGTTATGNILDTGASLTIGSRYPNPTAYATAKFDEVTISDTAWSSSTICTVYNSGTPLEYEGTTGTSTATTSTSTTNMDDTNFLLGVIIFFLAFLWIGFIFSPIRRK